MLAVELVIRDSVGRPGRVGPRYGDRGAEARLAAPRGIVIESWSRQAAEGAIMLVAGVDSSIPTQTPTEDGYRQLRFSWRPCRALRCVARPARARPRFEASDTGPHWP
jgi:hypothetical protein